MRALLLFLLLLSTPPPPPPFAATWATPTSARLSWTQPPAVHLTCLSRNATLIRCWVDAPPGPFVVALGSVGALDAAYRPHAGDVYTLEQDGTRQRAGLVGRALLPVVRG